MDRYGFEIEALDGLITAISDQTTTVKQPQEVARMLSCAQTL